MKLMILRIITTSGMPQALIVSASVAGVSSVKNDMRVK